MVVEALHRVTGVIEVAVSSQRGELVEKPPVPARAAVEHSQPHEGASARVRELAPPDPLPLGVVGAEPVALRAVLDHAAR